MMEWILIFAAPFFTGEDRLMQIPMADQQACRVAISNMNAEIRELPGWAGGGSNWYGVCLNQQTGEVIIMQTLEDE